MADTACYCHLLFSSFFPQTMSTAIPMSGHKTEHRPFFHQDMQYSFSPLEITYAMLLSVAHGTLTNVIKSDQGFPIPALSTFWIG